MLKLFAVFVNRRPLPKFSDDFDKMKTLALKNGKNDLLSKLQVYVDNRLKGNSSGISISIIDTCTCEKGT